MGFMGGVAEVQQPGTANPAESVLQATTRWHLFTTWSAYQVSFHGVTAGLGPVHLAALPGQQEAAMSPELALRNEGAIWCMLWATSTISGGRVDGTTDGGPPH